MPDLTKRTLGRTGVEVTTLGYGAMELRGAPRGRDVSHEDAGRILNAVLDSGINLIDTSIDYGMSEEFIGKHIAHRRDEYFLASKCGCVIGWQPTEPQQRGAPHIYTKENIVAGVEQSLRRMNSDHLDLLQVHMTPTKQVLEENDVIATMQELQSQGKIRFLGMSGTIPNIADHIAIGVFDVFQIPYSCLQRDHENVIQQAHDAGAGVFIRGGAARGAASDSEWARSRNADSVSTWERAGLDDLMGDMSAMEFVMRFTETHPGMTTNIVGTIDPGHLAQNLAAASNGTLPDDVYAEAKKRLADAGTAPKE